jgi:hypothetical protein
MKMLGLISVCVIGGLVCRAVMPDFPSSFIVSYVWGLAVGNFWGRNFPERTA